MPNAHPFEPYRGHAWRMIEGQYRPATLKLVDTQAEQERLEALVEDSKPPVPEPCRHLDYQFWSPFRYGCYPRDSRFRRRGRTPGVWYGSETPITAALEASWITLRFFAASPDTPLPETHSSHTLICADIAAPVAIDLTGPDMADKGNWTDPDDYTDCLTLADDLRTQYCEVIRYASVRDPDTRPNLAILSCAAFHTPRPVDMQTWHLLLSPTRIHLTNETRNRRHDFLIGATQFETAA